MNNDEDKNQQTQQRIEELEIKIAFQEHSIEELSDALTCQQRDIDKLHTQLRFLVNKLKAMEPANIAEQHEEAPPPHY